MIKIKIKPKTISFYVCTYYDFPLLESCLKYIRNSYPHTRTIVVSDGDPNPNIPKLCETHKAEFHKGNWEYGLHMGGRRIHRMLELFLNSPTDFLIKIDTDTRIMRPFSTPFRTHAVSGKLYSIKHHRPFIQGGCIVYPKEIATELYDNKMFLDHDLFDNPYAWCNFEATEYKLQNGLISEDQINSYCLQKIKCPLENHPEIHSVSPGDVDVSEVNQMLESKDQTYAVLHPCKAGVG